VQSEAGALELAMPQLRGTDDAFRPTLANQVRTRTADLESLVRGMYCYFEQWLKSSNSVTLN
jgi:hypothetical protein